MDVKAGTVYLTPNDNIIHELKKYYSDKGNEAFFFIIIQIIDTN